MKIQVSLLLLICHLFLQQSIREWKSDKEGYKLRSIQRKLQVMKKDLKQAVFSYVI